MTFLDGERLWLLVAVALLLGAYVWLQIRRRSTYAVRFTNLALLDVVAPKRPGWRRHVAAGAFLDWRACWSSAIARPARDVRCPRERATVPTWRAEVEGERGGEPSGTLRVRSSGLRGTEISGADVPLGDRRASPGRPRRLLRGGNNDDPRRRRAAAQGVGPDRDGSAALTALGGSVETTDDGMAIEGTGPCGAARSIPTATTGSR